MWKIKKDLGIDPILKWEIVKKFRKYKAGDEYGKICMEEKLAIISYNNPTELRNQRSEILNICRHKNVLLFRRLNISFLFFFFFGANFLYFRVTF